MQKVQILTDCFTSSFIGLQNISCCTGAKEAFFGVRALLRTGTRRFTLVDVHTIESTIEGFTGRTSTRWSLKGSKMENCKRTDESDKDKAKRG